MVTITFFLFCKRLSVFFDVCISPGSQCCECAAGPLSLTSWASLTSSPLWLLSLEVFKTSWMGPWASRSSVRSGGLWLTLWPGGNGFGIIGVPSKPSHSMILWRTRLILAQCHFHFGVDVLFRHSDEHNNIFMLCYKPDLCDSVLFILIFCITTSCSKLFVVKHSTRELHFQISISWHSQLFSCRFQLWEDMFRKDILQFPEVSCTPTWFYIPADERELSSFSGQCNELHGWKYLLSDLFYYS